MSKQPDRFPIPGMLRVGVVVLIGVGALAASAADMRNGERLYGIHCASCHGATGTPDMPGAPDLRRGRAMLRPDAQILQSVKRGRGAMPSYVGILGDREILDVLAYIRTLQ